jgi:TatD DNase family protein
MAISLIDTHVHLDLLPDPYAAVVEAKKKGVLGMVAVGMDWKSNEKILALSREIPDFVFPALGYHPEAITVSGIKENLHFLRTHLDQAVALGEIGLDFKISVPRELQEWVFKDLIELALETNKPLILHCRRSHAQVYELIRKHEVKKAVFHWYSGPVDILKELLLDGYFISATPALVYSPAHREAVAVAPLKQILIETDSPVTYRGEFSRPAQVLRTLEELSKIKRIDPEEASLKTTQNARKFFNLS